MHHQRCRCFELRLSGRLPFLAELIHVLWIFLVVQPGSLGATVHPHPRCEGECSDADHLCRSAVGDCKTAWDSCPPGTVQLGNETRFPDESDCHWTQCGHGGCEQGFAETDSKVGPSSPSAGAQSCSFDPIHCFAEAGVCKQEKCCPLRTSVRCCPLLPCNVSYDGCEVPQQTYLSDPSKGAVENISIAHMNSAFFPFYSAAELPASGGGGDGCDSVRQWGRCLCNDGLKVPGCEPSNSSTWFLKRDGPGGDNSSPTDAARLPANMSLTCVVLPPPAAAPAAAPSTNATAPPPPLPPALPSGGGTAGGGDHGGDGGGDGRSSSPPHERQGLVAAIVIGCLLLAGCTAGLVLWCSGLLPDLHNLRIRNLTTYEPIFTGQSYTSNMGGRQSRTPSSADEIPWTRFCAAVTEAGRRLLYGRRYLEESASAAAAAERYRTLNAFGRRRRGGGGSSDGEKEDDAAERAMPSGKPTSTRGSLLLATYPSVRRQAHPEDELNVDEVFTLEDLGAGSSDAAGLAFGGRPAGQRLPVSQVATVISGGLPPPPQQHPTPQSLRGGTCAAAAVPFPAGPWHGRPGGSTASASFHGGPSAAAAAAAATSAGQSRLRLNQFGLNTQAFAADASVAKAYGSGGGGGGGEGGGGGGHDVIHTRPLSLGDGDDDEMEVPPDVDAPLRWLPSPQVTGQEE